MSETSTRSVQLQNAPTVLIVGAGPTGLMLACELARRRVSFRLVEAVSRAPARVTRQGYSAAHLGGVR